MTERGLPIADGAPACPFVAFADDRDERASNPDHRHRCYAETEPAPRALAHQEAYCLSSAFPVCPTFQDWARREAARTRAETARAAETDAAAAAASQRNPPRNWAAPPPWLSRKGRGDKVTDPMWADDAADETVDGDGDEQVLADVPPLGRGLAGSYADQVASDPAAAPAAGMPHDDDDAVISPAAPARPSGPFAARPEPSAPSYRAPGWDEEPADPDDVLPRRFRRRERDSAGPVGGRAAGAPGPAPEWERPRPLEAYPTLRSRRLPELSVPPILVAIVAIALAAAVLFALPGLLGFGNPSAGGSPSPSVPVQTLRPSFNPTPVPKPTPVLYVVKAGDTLSGIAGRYGIALSDLIAANAETLPNPDKLRIGDQLIIPVPLATSLPAASQIPAAS